MTEKRFDRPVTVAPGGVHRRIETANEAADCLMAAWPLKRGPRHRDAVETCLKVLEGYRSTEDARAALIAAAQESMILVADQPDQ